MIPAAALADHAPNAARARARIERQIAMLERLAQIGMELAEACGRDARAMAPAPGHPSREPGRDPALVFARVARAVRMTIALESRLAGDLADLDRADARAEAARKDERRARLARVVDQAAEVAVEARREAGLRAGGPYWHREAVEDEIERLSSETYERLIDAEDGAVRGLSFEAAVAAVSDDLGLSPDWRARLYGATTPPPGPPPPPDTHPPPVILGRSGPRDRPEAGPTADDAAQTRGPGPADRDQGGAYPPSPPADVDAEAPSIQRTHGLPSGGRRKGPVELSG
jgi:hypothetical protein